MIVKKEAKWNDSNPICSFWDTSQNVLFLAMCYYCESQKGYVEFKNLNLTLLLLCTFYRRYEDKLRLISPQQSMWTLFYYFFFSLSLKTSSKCLRPQPQLRNQNQKPADSDAIKHGYFRKKYHTHLLYFLQSLIK